MVLITTKAISKKKKYKARWLSEEGLQIAEERSEAKGKSERYSQVIAVPENRKER